MEGGAGSRHALGTRAAGQDRDSQATGPGSDEAAAEHDRGVIRTRDARELSAAISLVARGASRWVMVCGLQDADALLEATAPSAALARVELRRTAPDTILVMGVGAPANLGHRAGARRGRDLLHAALAVAARVIGE